MSLKKLLDEKKMTLAISIPKNEPELARAAMDAGADVIKMHVNVDHWASGNSFGDANVYENEFREIRERFSGPLGIVPGGSFEAIERNQLEKLADFGFDYFSIYAHHMPSWLLDLDTFEKTFAITGNDSLDCIRKVKDLGIAAIEASIIPAKEYGSPLTFKDVLTYRQIVQSTDVPIIIPSQRRLIAADIPLLYQAGVKSVMLGAVVVGQTKESIEQTVFAFKNEIEKL
ncbi:hypothetical protein [Bacillus sp. FJAT-50079]|uniref:hypothetical protein n=1 Tax=Bacillus sp. FJAT-50079 TaxID=2833577 RepID=UPI001BC91A94|nr:hypothetical protein [Bacillus sp. FJAT-50079]MBS4207541.1 hypothetical protein [Bacillus sp. FJAT-50079]